MSNYTTEVRYICEVNAGYKESQGYKSVDQILKEVHSKIFDFDYPIFDESYRTTLECNILRHYYTREICAETVGLWKLWLDARMNEIMPYYNELYKTTLLDFNPLYDVDYTREGNRSVDETTKNTGTIADDGTHTKTGSVEDEGNKEKITQNDRNINQDNTGSITDFRTGTETTQKTGTDTTTMTGTDTNNKTGTQTEAKTGSDGVANTSAPKNNRWDLYSDTPQGGINGIENASEPGNSVGNNAYLTNARHIIEDGTGSTSNQTSTYGSQIQTTFNTQDQETRNLTDQNTKNLTDTLTLDTENERVFNRNTETDDQLRGNEKTDTSNVRTFDTLNKDGNVRTLNTQVKGDNLTEYLERVRGKRGRDSYAKMILDYRKLFLNIDKMIIDELSDLFFGLWG